MNKNTIILSVVSIAILLALIAYGSMQMKKPVVVDEEKFTACTMEAKQCPDGTYVGRQGPRCEFSPCPGN